MTLLLKFSVLTLTLTTNSVLGECLPNDLVPDGIGCLPTPNICEITCPKGEACELGESCAAVGVTEDMITGDEMTKEICPALCNDSSSSSSNETTRAIPCRFWRWDIETGDNEKCYLMSEGQCSTVLSCVAPSCYHGDIGCDGEKPAGKMCPGHMKFNNEPDFIHWGCANEDGELSSPYDENNPDMPAETICTTASRCFDYEKKGMAETDPLWRKLSVSCDGTTGHWQKVNEADGDDALYDLVIPNEGDSTIVEQKCAGGESPPITFDVDLASAGNGAGAALVCDMEGTMSETTYTITAPNHCLLLCDLHIGMTIDGRLDDKGEYEWVDQDGTAITDANGVNPVKCWVGRSV